MTRLLVVALAATNLVGCAAGYISGRFREAHPECESDVSVEPRPGDDVVDVSGCGITDTAHRVCLVQRCRYNMASEALERASFDLECPAENLETTILRDSLGIRGCGRRATYVTTWDGWVMNSAPIVSSSSGGSQPAAAPDESAESDNVESTP